MQFGFPSFMGLSKTTKLWLGAAVLLHVCLAALFAYQTPYRTEGKLVHQAGARVPDIGAPDERQHVNYVIQLARGEGFPILDPKDPKLYENYQAHQPPLYYLVASVPARFIGPNTLESPEGWTLRLLNVAIGAFTVLGVFFLALWSVKDERTALLSAIFVALLPMQLALDGAVNNDSLLFCLCSWALATMAKGLNSEWCFGISIRVGALIGLALLTKTTAIALLPVAALGLFGAAKLKTIHGVVRHAALTLGVGLAIPVLWWMRNLQIYGDPFAIRAFTESFTGSPQASAFISELGGYTYWTQWVGWWTARSFIGAFGYMDIFLPNWLYAASLLVGSASMLFGALRLSRATQNRWIDALLVSFLILVLLLFVRFNLQYFQGQARYILPALGPIAVLMGIGWNELWATKKSAALPVLAALMLALAGYSLSILPSEFQRRTSVSSTWHKNGVQGTESPAVSVQTS